MTRLAGVHASRGDSLKTIEAMAIDWNRRNVPPIEEKDVLKAVRGIWSKEDDKRKAKATTIVHRPQSSDIAASEEPEIDAPAAAFLGVSCREQRADEDEGPSDDWPKLGEDAFIGLAGDIIRAIEPETEADPAGILVSILTAFGAAVGKNPSFRMADSEHFANLFTALIGGTASGKGRAAKIIMALMKKAIPEWAKEDIAWGLSSGEGLVDRIKDEGEAESPEPKTLLCIETEFARTITAMRREGNTLSALLRGAWDGQTLDILTRGKSRIRATDPHVSLNAHATPEELNKLLKDSVETCNGFSNRILWTLVKRSKSLPEGGRHDALDEFVGPLREAIEKAREIGACWRDDEAKALWREVYDELTEERPGAYGMAVSRGHAQTLRLSLIYALLDGTQVIGERHLRAALAVWRYCEESARRLFGGQDGGEQPLHLRLLHMIAMQPGVKRNDLRKVLSSAKRGELAPALERLKAESLAHAKIVGEGRASSESWYPGPGDGPNGKPESSPFDWTWTVDDGGGDDPPPDPRTTIVHRPQSNGIAEAIAVSETTTIVHRPQSNGIAETTTIVHRPQSNDIAVSETTTIVHRPPSNGIAETTTIVHRPQSNDIAVSETATREPAIGNAAVTHLGVSGREPTPEDEDMSEERHLNAMREWAKVLNEKVKAQAHRLDPDAYARLGDPQWQEQTAERLYLQAWRCRPNRRSGDPLEPNVKDDVLWVERYVQGLRADDAKAKALESDPIGAGEWDDAFRSLLAEVGNPAAGY